ncbi:hypothetical protein [uncultured Tenacibaculum sp.]|uniref:hypothetical protein n=1 Tax=uncultured Tenacibaculum sp. TaxID=174713 RepID=UPI0026322743|nr:hypothetical protein [uncultured Tenacibaculum sp.]
MKKLIYILIIQLILISCGGSGNEPIEPEVELGVFELIFPENNTLCTEGKSISKGQVAIPLRWNISKNATSYKVVIINTDTGERTERTTNTNSIEVNLLKGTKFSWNVIAILNNKEKSSSTWNFYSEGVSVSNHIPFPASISIEDNKDGTINIKWVGSDLDNDIANYKVYLGESESTTVLIAETTNNSIENKSINYNKKYFLKIITIDEKDNSSSSIKEFRFNK